MFASGHLYNAESEVARQWAEEGSLVAKFRVPSNRIYT